MTAMNLQAFRRQLVALSNRLRGDGAALRDDARGVSGDDREAVDGSARIDDLACREADWDVTLGQLASEEHIRAEVDDALARIIGGTYGVCPECGENIPAGRLRAVPYARFYLACTERYEAVT